MLHRLITPTAALLLAACGAAPAPGDQSVPANAGAAAKTRYSMANACFAIQDQASGLYLSAGDTVEANASQLADATPLFMKPSALGRYLFYTPDAQYLALSTASEALGGGIIDATALVGDHVAGVGDIIAWVHPLLPVSDGLNAVGAAIRDGGQQAGNTVRSGRSLDLSATPHDGVEWDVVESPNGFVISSTATGDVLSVSADSVEFDFVPTTGCTPYPEAELNASGTPFSGTNPDGTVFGYAETHMHLGGSEALGGRLGYGGPFHRFGIPHALENCEVDHGPDGSIGVLDVFLSSSNKIPHDTVGWPSFNDWPTHSSQTHHQTYWVWLKRAWMGGLRFMVNHLVANEMLCQVWPYKQNDCDEMDNIELQRQLVLDLQDYIDAQEGGPGKGFFRIVTDPFTARQVIEDGKMAVILGTENEKVFSCGEYLDSPECSQEDIDRELDIWWDKGLRAIFPIHIFDNAFGGAEISRFTNDQGLIQLYNAGNVVETGHPYATVACSEAEAIEVGAAPVEDRSLFELVMFQVLHPFPTPFSGCVNNARPLTSTGDAFIHKLIDKGVMIETDHSGPLARKRMLDIAMERDVPVLSGHTGSISFSRDSARIAQTGGIISNLSDDPAPVTIAFIQDLVAMYRELGFPDNKIATGFGSDINGIHKQSKPRDDAADRPLPYPFTGYAGDVVFERQTSGERVFDLNVDGVAHYGLYPDYIADIGNQPGGQEALKYLFRSAEAYLQAWERSWAARKPD